MNLVLFVTVLIASFIIVRIGAVAFHLTGLEWSLAKFQALSCFTSTGFTTKEAELVTANRQRQRTASILIVLGHAGLVTMVATFANTLRPRATSWSIPSWLLPYQSCAAAISMSWPSSEALILPLIRAPTPGSFRATSCYVLVSSKTSETSSIPKINSSTHLPEPSPP